MRDQASTPFCDQCGADLLLIEDGPDGHPVWDCDPCGMFWDDKNGTPIGLPEKYGDRRGPRMFKPWSNTR